MFFVEQGEILMNYFRFIFRFFTREMFYISALKGADCRVISVSHISLAYILLSVNSHTGELQV